MSFEVICGQIRFLPSTFDRVEIEQWGWYICVSLAKTQRLTSDIAYLGHQVTSRVLDLRSDFDINIVRPTCIYFDSSRREEHDGL